MNRLTIINPLYLPEWDEWVLSTSSYSIFHSRAWARVLVESYGYTPCYLMLYDNGHPAAAWPVMQTNSFWSGKKGVSLPFSDHCEPIVSDDKYHRELFAGLRQHALQLKWKSLELRGGGNHLKQFPQATSYNLHFLELSPDEQKISKRLRSSTLRNIKKARKAKIDISIDRSFESVRDFYNLNCLTRKHHGLPPQPFNFFKNIYKYIISKDMGLIVLAHYRKHVTAGAVYFHFGANAVYKYGASNRKYLDIRPNNLVMWEAIKWYAGHGYKLFDFGRSEPDNLGLNQFKNGWGASVEQIAYYRYLPGQQKFVSNEGYFPSYMNQVFKLMPVPVLRIFGALAYRHMA